MLQISNTYFDEFTDDCKVWTYLSHRPIQSQEKVKIEKELDLFISRWETHGKKLRANFGVFYDHFIVFVVDEKVQDISGCSIDKSVHCLKNLGTQLDIDFFNRLNVLFVEAKDKLVEPYFKVKQRNSGFYFNPMISNLGDLRNNWVIALD